MIYLLYAAIIVNFLEIVRLFMETIYTFLIFFIGTALTSFYRLYGARFVKNETFLGASHCDQCGHALSIRDVFPLVGFVLNRGKCRFCGERVSYWYPTQEVLGGLVFALLYSIYGFSVDFWILVIALSVFIVETVSDIIDYVVIDRVWIIGLVLLVPIRVLQGAFFDHLLSSLGLFLFLYLVSYVGTKLTKQEALGGGDVKIYLFIGFVLPFTFGILSLFLAALVGLIYGMITIRKEKGLPFVPSIMLGVLITYLYGNDIMNYYYVFLEKVGLL